MTDEKRTFAKLFQGFFGRKPGQTLMEFGAEINELTEDDKVQLADGIENGTLNY
jgi:hypothetical protein